jgi:hypothetical protein
MNGQLRGKRLFGGRLFAGRLFGPPEQAAVIGGGGRLRVRVPEAMLDQRIEEDDFRGRQRPAAVRRAPWPG